MTISDITHYRLTSQRLANNTFTTAEEVVSWLCAVQSQDFPGAKWGVAQRMKSATNASLDEAFNAGKILRTHVMRPTWHFVTPEDIAWMIELTSPQVKKVLGSYNKKLELDDALFAKTNKLITKALQNNNYLTRQELRTILIENGFETNVQRLAHIVSWAELDGLICSGPIKEKQFTYALIDERAPKGKKLSREEAIGTLAMRYLISHGPAQVKDFSWWSGLKMNDARNGFAMNASQLQKETIDGKEYWFSTKSQAARIISPKIDLLPNYDEYGIAYADRSALEDTEHHFVLDARGNPFFMHLVMLDGRLVGSWKRTIKKNEVIIETKFIPLNKSEKEAFEKEVTNYGKFLDLPVTIKWIA